MLNIEFFKNTHSLTQEKNFKIKYPCEYKNINIFCENNNLYLDVFGQKLFHYIHQLHIINSCIICNKNAKFIKFSKGYSLWCSRNCFNIDKQTIKTIVHKSQETCMKKYNVKNPMQSTHIQESIKTNLLFLMN